MIILLPLFFITKLDLGLLEYLQEYSKPLHQLCIELAPKSDWSFATKALVCGKNIPQSDFFDALKKTSLLHLAIVSGSHLVLLEKILRTTISTSSEKINIHFHYLTPLIISLLFIYCLVCNWQPPAVRSLITLLVQTLSSKQKLFWPPLHITWVSGLVTWMLFPEWTNSLSFLLSWGASLGLSLYEENNTSGFLKQFINQWKTHLLVYITLIPLLIPLTLPHPLTILCNWLIGPLLGVLLFPMGILTLIFPFIYHLTDFLWEQIATLLILTSQYIPEINITSEFTGATNTKALWIYIFSLQIICHLIRITEKRSCHSE